MKIKETRLFTDTESKTLLTINYLRALRYKIGTKNKIIINI